MRYMSDQEILEKYVDLSDSDLSYAERGVYTKFFLSTRKHFLLGMR